MRTIPLTHGFEAMVDDEDYEELMLFTWHAKPGYSTWYAYRVVDGVYIGMHQCLLTCEEGETPDHKDRNGLNNQKDNLRPATPQQQSCNAVVPQTEKGSGYRGVSPTRYGMYQARISIDYKRVCIGNYNTAEEAAKAYDEKALQLHGEFATLNFP